MGGRGLVVLYSNVDVFTGGKKSELLRFLGKIRPDLVALTEIFPKSVPNEKLTESLLSVGGYELVLPFSGGGAAPRGVAFLVREGIPFKISEIVDFQESLVVRLFLSPFGSVSLGLVYRSPRSPVSSQLAAFATEFFSGPGPKVLLGDFNIPGVKWENFQGGSAEVGRFFEVLLRENVTQVVDGFTRFGRNQCPSLLDLCFVQNLVLPSIECLPPLGKSDHCVLKFAFDLDVPSASTFRRLWRCADYEKINKSLSLVDWDKLFENCSIEDAWSSFEKVVSEIVEEHVPRVSVNKNSFTAPWFGKRCKLACRSKARAWKRFRFSGNPNFLPLYLSARQKCSKILLQERRNFEASLGAKIVENPKAFWSHVNSSIVHRPGINSVENEGKVLVKDSEIADAYSEYFSSVFVTEPPGPLPTPPVWPVQTTLGEFSAPDVEEIEREIEGLKIGKSCGPDNLPAEFLKGTKMVIARPLKLLFDMSIKTSLIPFGWKRGLVCPIHKSGPKSVVSNFRPISLLSIVGKILEKFVFAQTIKIIEKNGGMISEQYGFRPGRSVNLQLLEVLNYITKSVNSGKPVDTLYLDFKKAFDTVPHRRLISKLGALGVQGSALKWFENYLCGRVQAVRIREAVSSDKSVLSGVPQGSILGPLLFLVYIADLPRVVSLPSQIRLFADDAKIFREILGKDDEIGVQNDIDRVSNWCKIWLLQLNFQKCKVMRFGKSSSSPKYTLLDGTQRRLIEVVSEEKDLGVIFDQKLEFRTHIDTKVKAASRILALIRHSFKYLDRKTFILLYKSLVRPHLEYCSPIWNPSTRMLANSIEKIQKRATKLVYRFDEIPYEGRLRALGLPSLEFRRYREDVITAFKVCKFYPDLKYIFSFQPRLGLRGHELCFQKERVRTRVFRNSLQNRLHSRWNGLPQQFAHIPTLNGLKGFLDKHYDLERFTCRLPSSGSKPGGVAGRAELGELGARQG